MTLNDFELEIITAVSVSTGDVFGRLKVMATGQIPGTHRYMAICECECGSPPKAVRFDALKSGVTISCGCIHRDVVTTHGLTKSGHYHRWRNMMDRCYNENNSAWDDYGGRDIKVCERWHDIRNFVADLPPGYQEGLEIDRIDNNKGYEPGNIKWSTCKQNAENRRSTRWLEFEGKTQTITQWAREKGFPHGLINSRLDVFGWSIGRALTEPVAEKTENMRRAQSMRWAGHVKKAAPKPLVAKRFMFNGREQTIREISQYTGISEQLLRKRLCERGWPIDKATLKT
jgi:hypothetical protein